MNNPHPSPFVADSQCDRILRALLAHRGEWLPMPYLYSMSGAFAVHSRIADLRRHGYTVETRVEHVKNKVNSYYRIP